MQLEHSQIDPRQAWFDFWLVGFYGISTFVGHLMPNPIHINNQFYFKQFSLAWVHSLIVKDISIQFIQTVLIQLIQFSISTDFVYTVKCQNSSIYNNSV